jgi:hypothetical protein
MAVQLVWDRLAQALETQEVILFSDRLRPSEVVTEILVLEELVDQVAGGGTLEFSVEQVHPAKEIKAEWVHKVHL